MTQSILLCATLTLVLSIPAMARQELYRWTDPITGQIVTTPTPPPYPIKNKHPGGTLPGVDMYNVELDENTPQVKTATAKRKAQEAEQQRITEERAKARAAKEDEQKRIAQGKAEENKRIAEQKAVQDAENARLEKRNAAIRAEQQHIKEQEEAEKLAAAKVREPTTEEKDNCLNVLKNTYNFKDPESMRIEGNPGTILFADGGKKVFIKVNAKNSYGAYAGAKNYVCNFSPDGRTEVVEKEP